MGSFIELNDTLQLTSEQGFPKELDLEKHRAKPFTAKDFEGRTFEFYDKEGARVFHTPPTRVFLVHNINGKWLYWGHALILTQTIHSDANGKTQSTSGTFIITKIYDVKHQEAMTRHETSPGKSYFP